MNNYPPLFISTQPFIPGSSQISKVPQQKKLGKQDQTTQDGVSFNDLLTDSVAKQEKLRFSAHAQERAHMRNIRFNENQLARLGEGVEKVSNKGSREALVLVDNVAAVVNVTNKTVITLADTSSTRENVYTNIDSTVIV
ncbi:TIGR02530 family flagellar biosynthesis protein [Candidatus Omnitrophota bacterium]